MTILPVNDPAFAPYGRVIAGYDTAVLLNTLCEKTPKPESGTMYAVQFARRYLGTKNIYAVEFDKYDDNNLGNKYLIEQGIAKPITIE